jgi:hypothetical protein
MSPKIKIYLDTSVINFLFADDAPEFKQVTEDFFAEYVAKQIYEVYASDIVILEIMKTNDLQKRNQLLSIIQKYQIPLLSLNQEAEQLAKKYIDEGIIPAKKLEDAQHIGLATVEQINILLSWNFKHLANVNKRLKVKLLNEREGYFYPLDLLTPLQVMYEND